MRKILLCLIIFTCICGIVGAAYTYNEYTKYLENLDSDTDEPTEEPPVDPIDCLHAEEVVLSAVAPTCYKEGRSEGVKCKHCGTILVEQEVISKLSHTPEIIPAVEATCKTPGKTIGSKCSVCHEVLVQPEETGLGEHSTYTVAAVASTCSTPGTTSYIKCSTCFANITEPSSLALIPHDFSVEVAEVEPTCWDLGFSYHHICSVCKAKDSEYEVYARRPHADYVSKPASEPTCTSYGYTAEVKCSWCNFILEDAMQIPMLDHMPMAIGGIEATCTSPGETYEIVCEFCYTLLEEAQPIPVLPHAPVEVVGDPSTCTENGCTSYYYCEDCGITLVESETLPLAPHTEVAIASIAATCTKYGYSGGKECSVCGTITKEPIQEPKLQHNYVALTDEEATCVTEGRTGGTQCTVCRTYGEFPTYTPELGHYFGDNFTNKCEWCRVSITPASGLQYELDVSHSATITSASSYPGDVLVLPETINGYDVTRLGWHSIQNNNIKTVVITGYVRVIEGRAFYNCENLEKVYIYGGVTYGSSFLFENCPNLTDVYIQFKEGMLPPAWETDWYLGVPEGCTIHYLAPDTINYAFKYSLNADGQSYSVTGLDYDYTIDSKLAIPATYNGLPVTAIAPYAFASTYRLRELEVPSSVTTVGEFAFKGCTTIEKIIFYGEVSVGTYAFGVTDNLRTVNTNMIISMEEHAFQSSGITIVETSPKLKVIPKYCFNNCEYLTSVYLTEGLTVIENNAFAECTALENVYLPDGLERISYGVFARCHSLSTIYIPASVSIMGYDETGRGGGNVFFNQNGMTIRCGAASRPSGWYEDWNASDYDYDTGDVIAHYPTTWGQSR